MWTATVTLDHDKPDVGTVSATFTDGDGSTFSHSARVRITVADRDVFIWQAIALRDQWRTRKAAEAGYSANVTNAFAQADN